MKGTVSLAVLISSISICQAAPSQIRSESAGNDIIQLPLRKRDDHGRANRRDISAPLEHDAYRYLVDLDIGTPPQTVALCIDTGSSDTWVFGPGSCDACEGGVFNPKKSSTGLYAEDLGPLEISYMDDNQISGYFIQDTVSLGSTTVTDVVLAVAENSSLTNNPPGIMGLGLPGLQHSKVQYPGFVDDLYAQGFISTRSYSIYLDRFESGEGVLTFGGIDDTKYSGVLTPLDIVPWAEFPRLQVMWTSLSITDGEGTETGLTEEGFGYAVAMDTGYARSVLPADIFDYLAKLWDVKVGPNGNNRVACDTLGEGYMWFGFGAGPDVEIGVPFSELAVPIPGEDMCMFGFWRMEEGSDPMMAMTFGDTFMRSAYTHFDLDTMTISLAPAVWS